MAREISRQTFLRGAAGALAAGAVFGSVRATADPAASGWEALSSALGGKVLQPDDGPQFATAKQVFNTNYNGYTPAVIVTPTSQLDVQKAMAFAAANNLKVAPRGGGHSYVGASTANGAMVLDLRQLPGDINYDATTGRVTVTPATGLYAMHQVLAAAGLDPLHLAISDQVIEVEADGVGMHAQLAGDRGDAHRNPRRTQCPQHRTTAPHRLLQ